MLVQVQQFTFGLSQVEKTSEGLPIPITHTHTPAQWKTYSLAIVKYDGAVGPAAVVHQTQVGEDAHAHCL